MCIDAPAVRRAQGEEQERFVLFFIVEVRINYRLARGLTPTLPTKKAVAILAIV